MCGNITATVIYFLPSIDTRLTSVDAFVVVREQQQPVESLFQKLWTCCEQFENGIGAGILGDRGKLCDALVTHFKHHCRGCSIPPLLLLLLLALALALALLVWRWGQEQIDTIQLLVACQTVRDAFRSCGCDGGREAL